MDPEHVNFLEELGKEFQPLFCALGDLRETTYCTQTETV